MLETIKRYYAVERQFAISGTGIGLLLMLFSAAAWRLSSPGSVTRGVAYTLVATGLFHALASGAYLKIVPERAAQSVRLYADLPEREVRMREQKRMQGVLRTGYIAALLLNCACVVSGMILSFEASDAWKGAAWVLIGYGLVACCSEAYSMRTNWFYLRTVCA